MEQTEAVALIRAAIVRSGGTWADLGAGNGTFTRALASLIGASGVVVAVDRDARAMRGLTQDASGKTGAAIRTIAGDFTTPLDLPPLDGVLLANALHFVPYDAQSRVLRQIVEYVKDGGVAVIVEYERSQANPYVPFPVTFAALERLATQVGLAPPQLLATKPSRYQGSIYAASLGIRTDPVTAAQPGA
jgi:SAM-dependent methyltransferase